MNRTLILKEEVYEVVSCAIEVINELGHGLHEKPYENALVVEFKERLIINFKHAKLQWERIVLTQPD